jgi:hypothetical protein
VARAQVKVTFKKWGRKHTVDASQAPATPTRAERITHAKRKHFFGGLAAKQATVAAAEAALVARMGGAGSREATAFLAATGTGTARVAGAAAAAASSTP